MLDINFDTIANKNIQETISFLCPHCHSVASISINGNISEIGMSSLYIKSFATCCNCGSDDMFEIDPLMIDLVRNLNIAGIKPLRCCEGHPFDVYITNSPISIDISATRHDAFDFIGPWIDIALNEMSAYSLSVFILAFQESFKKINFKSIYIDHINNGLRIFCPVILNSDNLIAGEKSGDMMCERNAIREQLISKAFSAFKEFIYILVENYNEINKKIKNNYTHMIINKEKET